MGAPTVESDDCSSSQVAHSENPAARTSLPFERYVDHCEAMNRRSVFGMLRLTMESPSLTRALAMRLSLIHISEPTRLALI
eukprot:858152-Alexandrium_andersonii.AAC.1